MLGQAQPKQYLMSGGLGDYLRSNQGSMFNLAAGLLGGREGLQQALANMPQAQAQDRATADRQRQNAALQQYLGSQQIAPEKKALLSAFPQLAAQQAFAQPDQTGGMKEYNLAKEQGFGGSFLDYQTALKRAGASNNNITVGGKYGTIPSGYRLVEGPEGATMEPVPGSPAAMEAEQAANQQNMREGQKSAQSDLVSGTINNVLNTLRTSDMPLTGWASLASGIPGTPQHDLAQKLSTIEANIGFDKLQAMREASPTGGALGAVSGREMDLLQAVFGSLKQSQSKGQLVGNLELANEVMSAIVHHGIQPGSPLETRILELATGSAGGMGNDPLGLF